jgi:hypothetical protein
MTDPIARESPRPALLEDAWRNALVDPSTGTYVGRPGPRGRRRLLTALPLMRDGPRQLRPNELLRDAWGCSLADPDGNVLGKPGVYVPRLLNARWVDDTRRL